MRNSTEIFSIALGLQAPWYIKEVIFDKESSQLDTHLAFTKGYKFKGDDGAEYTAHDTIERSWRHLNFFQHQCYLHAKVPRIKQSDGNIKTQPVPWARKGLSTWCGLKITRWAIGIPMNMGAFPIQQGFSF